MGGLKRILFVDDHRALLTALRHALRPQRARWEMEFVADGNAALAAMAQRPFDVVVSDLKLPDIDGVRLLDQVRAQYPTTARVMLCAVAGPEDVVRAAPVVHRMLPKPFPVPRLESELEQSLETQAHLQDQAMRALIGRIGDIPVVPAIYVELCEASRRADTDVERLATIVARDPAVAAKVMQLAGSAYFGQVPTSLRQAVFFLGDELIKAIALSTHVFARGDDDPSLPNELRASTIAASAMSAVALVRRLSPQRAELAAVSALLRDFGTLLLVDAMPERMRTVADLARRSRKPRTAIERELLGVTHADVGAYLLGLWGLPPPVVEAVAHHHDSAYEPKDLNSSVALASQLVDHVSKIPNELDVEKVDRAWLELAAGAKP
ncbi:MAG: HDOD domain-containing protein [Archangiaceae bacterium]|nr:HDOD domain-containing protein [Archangiaceae bacterium]